MLSPSKPLDEIQPNLVCELLTWMKRAREFFGPAPPLGPGEGSKGQISFNFNYKVNFKDFKPLSKMKDTKHIRRGFICRLGHPPGLGLKGVRGIQGAKNIFFSNIAMWHIESTKMTSRTECK